MTLHDDVDRRLREAVHGALQTLAVDPPLQRQGLRPLRHSRRRLVWAVALACIAALLATTVALGHRGAQKPLAAESTPSAAPSATASATAAPPTVPPAAGGVQNGAAAPTRQAGVAGVAQPQCASGHNGGATAPGVTATSITLAMTTTDTGPMQGVVGGARSAVLAAVNRVNRDGGICGRRLTVQARDDGGDAARGQQDIENFINSGQVFALVAMPSPWGLDSALGAGDIDRAGIPVVGNDAMLALHRNDPWTWPVGATTVTTVRVAAHDARQRGAHTFAFVYETAEPNSGYTAGAFQAQVQRDGGSVDPACVIRLQTGAGDYSSQMRQFNQACGSGRSDGGVDFVMLDLAPATQSTWFRGYLGTSHPYMGVRADGSGEGAGVPTSMDVSGYAENCGSPCQLRVWSALHPFADPYATSAAMQQYRQDLGAVDPSAYPGNPYTEAAYAGTEVLVHALKAVGPVVTRSTLQDALGRLTFDLGIPVAPFHYAADAHIASQAMQGYLVQYDSASGGVTYGAATGVYTDPCAACSDPPA